MRIKTFFNSKNILLLLVVLFCVNPGRSQDQLDSLKQLMGYEESKELVMKLIELGNQNILVDNELVEKVANEAGDISRRINFPSGEANSYNLIAITEHLTGNYSKAHEIVNKAIAIFSEIGDTVGLASAYSNLGAVYNSMGEAEKSIEVLHASLDYYKELKDTLTQCKVTANIGVMYGEIDDWQKAKSYFLQAKTLTNTMSDFNIRGDIYQRLGDAYFQLDQLDSARLTLDHAQELVNHSGNQLTQAEISFVRGNIFLNENKPAEAISEHKKAEKIFEDYSYIWRLNNLNTALAMDYLEMENTDSAKYYALKVLNARENDQFAFLKANQLITKVYIRENNADSADYFFNETIRIKEELLTEQKLKKIQELEIQYETERLKGEMTEVQHEIAQTKSTNERQTLWIIIIGIVSVAALTIGLLLYRQYRRQKEQDFAHLEHQLLKARMNPHFIFNCLSSIQYLYAKNEKEKANDYMADFATLIRKTLDYTAGQKITISEEIEMLKLYMEMEKLRVDGAFNYEIEVSENLASEYDRIPPMLIQPLVENAIWHGILPTNVKGKIKVCFSRVNNRISCVISDNGVGFSPTDIRPDSKGIGLIEKRIGRRIEFTALSPGTRAEILI